MRGIVENGASIAPFFGLIPYIGNFPVGLVLLWGLKRGDFLAQKGAPKIGQKVAPQSPKPNGKLLSYIASSGCNTDHTDLASRGRKTIVVVCNGGRHRSAAVACALLVLTDGLSVEAAVSWLICCCFVWIVLD